MKNVLIFSLVLFVSWCCACPLCAQSCQPSPACKAVCTKKADAASADVAPMPTAQTVAVKKSCSAATVKSCSSTTAKSGSTEAQVLLASLFAPGTVTDTKEAMNCDPTNCDPTQCDLSKCDLSKCKPANCKGDGGKAKAIRL